MDVIVIEDEKAAAKNLLTLLKAIGDINVIATFETISESVAWFRSRPHPDLVFLDIHLADGSAFEIFNQVEINCPVVFATAYDDYAINAFQVNSIDYLLKPIEAKAVERSIQKFRKLSGNGGMSGEIQKLISQIGKKTTYRSSFLVPAKADKLIPVPVDNIACVYIENSMTTILTLDERKFPVEDSLDEIIETLDPSEFIRVNRQYVLARKAIKDVDLWFNSRLSINLTVKTVEKIITSRSRTSGFKSWFTNS